MLQRIAVDKALHQLSVKSVESRRAALCLFISTGIFRQLLIEGDIADKSANRAGSQPYITARVVTRLISRFEQDAAVSGYVALLIECLELRPLAIWTDWSLSHFSFPFVS